MSWDMDPYSAALQEWRRMKEENAELEEENARLEIERCRLQADVEQLAVEKLVLEIVHDQLEEEGARLEAEHGALLQELHRRTRP